MKKQEVEYKETEVFDLFPKFEYTRRQRQRIILFHAYAKNIKKIINYASHFDVPNKICLIYIVGEPKPERIMKALEESGCSSNVCVLTSSFSGEQMDIYDAFQKIRESIGKICGWDDDKQYFSDSYLAETEKMRNALSMPDTPDWINDIYKNRLDEIETVDKCQKELERIKKECFKVFTCYRVGCLPKQFTHEKLDDLIISVFPCGTEALGINDTASISPALSEKGILQIKTGKPEKRLGFDIKDNTPLVKAIKKYINKQLDDPGYVNLQELGRFLQQPPYGAMRCAYTAACLTYALSAYRSRTMLFYDSVCTLVAEGHESVFLSYMFPIDAKERRNAERRPAFLYIESHPHKVVKKMIYEVFCVPMKVPSTETIQLARRKMEKKYRLPLIAADERLYMLLDIGWRWYDRGSVEKLADMVDGKTEELCDQFFRYRMLDKKIKGNDRNSYAQCSSWLWTEDHVANPPKRICRRTSALEGVDE